MVTLLLGLIVYQFNIKRTLKTYQEYSTLQEDIKRAENINDEIAKYEQELKVLEQSSLQIYNKEKLLELVINFCRDHDLLIKTYPQAEKNIENNFVIVTNRIEVEGLYRDIVKLVYFLEQQEKIGSVAHLHFFLIKDRKKKRNVLRSEIILRNLES